MSLSELKNVRKKEGDFSPTIFTILVALFHKGTTAFMILFFTWFLNPTEYGDYSVFNSWMGIVTVFATLQLYYGVYTQGLVKFENDSDIFSSTMQGLNFIMCAAWMGICTISCLFGGFAIFGSFIRIVLMFAIIWSNAVYEFWATRQRVLLNYRRLLCIVVIEASLQLIITTALVLHSDNRADGWIIGTAISQVLVYSFLFIDQIIRGKKIIDKFYWKYALAFNIPLIPHYLSQIVLNSSDRIMINSLVGADKAGVYSYAYHVAMIMSMIQAAILGVINPWIYKQIKLGNENKIASRAYFLLLVVALGNLAVIAVAPEIVHLLAPEEYVDAIWVIPPVSMGCFITFAYSLFADFSFYYQKTFNIMIASVSGAILNIVLNYIFIPRFGYIAAGYTTLICYLIYVLLHYIFMRNICVKITGKQEVYDVKKLFAIFIGFIGLGFINMLGYKFIFIRIIFLIGTISIIFYYRRKIIRIIRNIDD